MELPLSLKELDKIINLLKNSSELSLYKKLWGYKMNYLKGDSN